MFEMSVLMFHFPMERTCPKARIEAHKQHDKFLKLELRSCKLNFIQEFVYRLYEYFYYQILGALSDSNPYQEGRKQADATFRELITLAKITAGAASQAQQNNNSASQQDFDQLDPLTVHPHWTILNAHIFSEL